MIRNAEDLLKKLNKGDAFVVKLKENCSHIRGWAGWFCRSVDHAVVMVVIHKSLQSGIEWEPHPLYGDKGTKYVSEALSASLRGDIIDVFFEHYEIHKVGPDDEP